MTDTVTPQRRSEIMSRVRSKDTVPELAVRRIVFGLGRRYRLHVRNLPGRPDLVLQRDRKIINVNGCMWHQHAGCKLARLPKSRLDFWLPKLEANKARDRRNNRDLKGAGWRVLTVWECELPHGTKLRRKIEGFLNA